MAARYLIGTGNRNWNDTANWSATSGGVGGASVPTSDDDVYFDSNSGTGTITVNAIANMRDCTFAQTQLITLANAAYAFNIYGNWTLCSNTYLNTSFTGTGYVYLKATTSVNITSNGCTRGWNRLYFDGVGGVWTNQDDWNTVMTAIYCANGEWVTNNKTFTTYYGIISAPGTKIITFGNSIINTGSVDLSIGVTTVRPNTATLNINGGFNGIGATWHNINLVSSSACNLAGNNTIYNLTRNSGPSLVATITLYNNQTVINNLTFTGSNSQNYRLLIASNIIGTPRTITCNGTITASNVDFRDIVGAGTANWDLSAIEGGSGDCGGNSGITFTPAQTQYFKHTLGVVNWSDVTKWFSNYERTIAGRVPLPQDDAIFDENSFTGASTLTVDVPRIGGLDMENINQLITISRTVAVRVHKNFILHPSILWGADIGYYWRFITDNNSIIKFENTNYPQQTEFLIGTFNFGSDFKAGTIRNSATIYSNDYNISVGVLSSTGLANFYAGSSFIQISNIANESAPPLYIDNSFYSGTSTIKVSLAGTQNSNLLLVNTTLNRLWLSGTHTGFYIIQPNYNNYINELIIDAGRKLSLKNGRTQTINKLTALGTQSQPITIGSTTAGQRHTINYTGSEASTVEYCNISDSAIVQADKLYALNSVDGGNNVNWIFIVGYKMYSGVNRVLKAYLGNTLLKNIYLGNESII